MKTTIFEVVKFAVATLLASAMLYLHAYVKELPVMLMAAPYLLMGVDVSKFVSFGGGKK